MLISNFADYIIVVSNILTNHIILLVAYYKQHFITFLKELSERRRKVIWTWGGPVNFCCSLEESPFKIFFLKEVFPSPGYKLSLENSLHFCFYYFVLKISFPHCCPDHLILNCFSSSLGMSSLCRTPGIIYNPFLLIFRKLLKPAPFFDTCGFSWIDY